MPKVGRKCCHSWLAGGIFRYGSKLRAAHRRFVRGGPNEEDPVAELLSEHGFAGKCSTSHVVGPRGLGSGSG